MFIMYEIRHKVNNGIKCISRALAATKLKNEHFQSEVMVTTHSNCNIEAVMNYSAWLQLYGG